MKQTRKTTRKPGSRHREVISLHAIATAPARKTRLHTHNMAWSGVDARLTRLSKAA